MRRIPVVLLLSLSLTAHAYVENWTNTLGGDWSVPSNWSPNIVPQPGDLVNITNAGTYVVTMTAPAGATLSGLNLGGSSGSQTLIYGSANSLYLTNGAVVATGGVLAITNGGLAGAVTVQTNATLQFSGTATKLLYGLSLNNQGAVAWSGGTMAFSTTAIVNYGLWQMTSDDNIVLGGSPSYITNYGVFQKLSGAGTSLINSIPFFNQPGSTIDARSGTLLVNSSGNCTLGGTLNATVPGTVSLGGGIWTEAGAVTTGTGTNQFVSGTLNLVSNSIPLLKLTGGTIYIVGTNSFQQAGAITNLTLDGATLAGTNSIGAGTLTFNSGDLADQLTVSPAGQLVLATATTKTLYSFTLVNQGTVNWNSGGLYFGSTVISNGGLWQMMADNTVTWAGNILPLWTNSGVLRKTGGSANSGLNAMNFVNQPGGTVDAQSGTILLGNGTNGILGGNLNTSSLAAINLNGGTWTDAGATVTGTGTCQFSAGTFNLRTNTISRLTLAGGNIYITGTNTFQQGGLITNLILDGATLLGSNSIGAGALTFNSGNLGGQLTVLPPGQLLLATTTTKTFYSFTLLNQGTVTWSAGGLYFGSTIISNGGLWQMPSDNTINWAGNNLPVWTNGGILRKTGGTATSSLGAMSFTNLPGAIVEADSGTLALPPNTTNAAGTLRLNGGTITGLSTLGFTGGTIDGTGAIGSITPTGGIITPGQNGPGGLSFNSGLTLAAGVTLIMDGTGTNAGSQYDQLSVTGAVSLGNAALQVTALPAVPTGTTFVIIANDGTDPISGTFNNLPENALISVGAQPFRIHYAGGTGNDVTLVRDAGEQLTRPSAGGGTLTLTGSGSGPGVYTVQATTNLVNWTNIGTGAADAAGHLTFLDTNAALFPYRFYRTTN